jgi:hypothetical protein
MWNNLGRGILEEFAGRQALAERGTDTDGWLKEDDETQEQDTKRKPSKRRTLKRCR